MNKAPNIRERRIAAAQAAVKARTERKRYKHEMITTATYTRRRLAIGTLFFSGILLVALKTEGDVAPPEWEKITPTQVTTGYLESDRVEALLEYERTTVVITPPPSTTEAPLVADPLDFVDEARGMYGECGEFHDMALSVGWGESEWKTLSRVMWRESRCQTDAWNGHDAGLTQINQIHSKWISDMGLEHPESMFDPALNLRFAYLLYSGREANGQCGWKPWSIPCP